MTWQGSIGLVLAVAAGATAQQKGAGPKAEPDIALESGRVLEVRVNDPGNELDRNEVKGRGVHLLIGAWSTDGQFHDAQVVERGNGLRRYEVLVPFDTDVRLEVKGRKLDLDDDKGKAKKEDDPPELVRVARSPSQASQKFVLQVKGVKP